MSQFTKNLELDSVLASGTAQPGWRDSSTHFDQRRVLDASGVAVSITDARTYASDGALGMSDYYRMTVNGTGILQVDIRNHNNCGSVLILDAAGTTVMTAKPSKYSVRNSAVTQTRIATSGTYYTYIQLKGRSGTEYRVGIDLQVR